MTTSPVSLQDLRRRIYGKAKAEKTKRFWGLYVHVGACDVAQPTRARATASTAARRRVVWRTVSSLPQSEIADLFGPSFVEEAPGVHLPNGPFSRDDDSGDGPAMRRSGDPRPGLSREWRSWGRALQAGEGRPPAMARRPRPPCVSTG